MSFERSVVQTISFLEKEGIDYFILGGLAVGLLGEPRYTYDLDIDVFILKDELEMWLGKIKRAKFRVQSSVAVKTVRQFGTFRLYRGKLQVDFILASTDLERSALRRRRRLSLFGRKMWFPSPEDLILLKIIPGRPKDLVDADSVILRHRPRLDVGYMRGWARRVADDAEDYRVIHTLEKLLEPIS